MSAVELQPPLRWVGGKRWLVPRLRELYAPHKDRRLVESFLGGGAVVLGLQPKRARLTDVNAHLIVFYNRLRDSRPFTIRMENTAEAYYAHRERFNDLIGSDEGRFSSEAAELFYYLNRTCFPAGTQLWKEDETQVPIENVRVGDRVWGGRVVKEVLRRPYIGSIVSIRVQGMPSAAIATADHPYLVVPKTEGREYRSPSKMLEQAEFRTANDLKVGDWLLTPRSGVENTIDWSKFWPSDIELGPQAQSRHFCPNDRDIARFIGYYLADGNSNILPEPGPRNGRKGTIAITCSTEMWHSTTDKHLMSDDVVAIAKKCFDVDARVTDDGGRRTIELGSVHLARFLDVLVPGKTWAEDPEQRHTKRLNHVLMTAPVDIQFEILRGWLRGDGGLRTKAGKECLELSGTTVVPEIARQMYRIALRCGLRPSWRVSYPNGRPTQVVWFGIGDDVRKLGFSGTVGSSAPRARRKIVGDYVASRILEITQLQFDGTVFNVEVDGDHLICVDRLVSHNCFNGVCRFNRSGKFNVPYGKKKSVEYRRDFSEYAEMLWSWDFGIGSFERCLPSAGDFWYLDPPYDVEFTTYSQGGFTWEQQVQLASLAAAHSGPVVACNQATDRILDLYRGLKFSIETIEAPRSVSCNGDRRPALELLATKNI